MNALLDQKVLVLNKSYAPITIISARKAFIKLYIGVAEVVLPENGNYSSYDFTSWAKLSAYRTQFDIFSEDTRFVHTPNLTLLVPKVLRLLTYSKVPYSMVKLNRKNIYARDLNTCQYCGKKLPADKLNLDHVVPRSMGGKNSWTNLVCTCHECNTMKGNRRPHEAGMKLLRKPEKPVFHSLFFHYIPPDKYDSWKHFLPQMPKPAMAVKES